MLQMLAGGSSYYLETEVREEKEDNFTLTLSLSLSNTRLLAPSVSLSKAHAYVGETEPVLDECAWCHMQVTCKLEYFS